MHRVAELPARSPFSPTREGAGNHQRHLPVLSSSLSSSEPSPSEPMDISAAGTTAPSAPSAQNIVDHDPSTAHSTSNSSSSSNSNNVNGSAENNPSSTTSVPTQNIGAAAAAQQPKVVQTAFIHKLYNMLEDQSIQHLISWSSSNESFVMSPTSEFSKVLAQYFKHTNISSFVRQLNMYGFHKVSDVFHTGSPDSALWEFKHGNGSFKRGDLVGLREIKRRASRHALIHRDSFSGHKPGSTQPGTPAEPALETADARLMTLEHSIYDLFHRLSRMEDSHSLLSARCQALTESLVKCHQWTHSVSHFLMVMTPDRESNLFRDVSNMQREIERQLEIVPALENPHETLLSSRQPYFSNISMESGPPLSPRQTPQDDSRRPSIVDSARATPLRPPVPQHLAVSPRRYGSISGGNPSSSYNKPQLPPQQAPLPQPLALSPPDGPNLARRHTSADIRQHGWPPTGISPFATNQAAGNSSPAWPPSPQHVPTASEQQVREVLAQYEFNGSKRRNDISRTATPPLSSDPLSSNSNPDSGWAVSGPKFPRHDTSLPATRRSSMASNVHSLLNPAGDGERGDGDEDRKRKRLQ